jgi:hypothetical protein
LVLFFSSFQLFAFLLFARQTRDIFAAMLLVLLLSLALFYRVCCAVLQVEALRELKIKLHSAALVLTFKGIKKLHVNLRSIESAVLRLYLPGLAKANKSLSKLLFCIIPDILFTKKIFRTC